MKKLYALGETTFDILIKEGKAFESKVGGSVLNTAVSLGRLGVPVNMVASCGTDDVGQTTSQFLLSNNIDISSLTIYSGTSRIALAFLDEKNNARYTFYKGLNPDNTELSFPSIEADSFVLFGSSFAIKPDLHEKLLTFLTHAKEKVSIIYYDPNVRPSQFSTNTKAKDWIINNIKLSNIIKGSDEDFWALFGTKTSLETYNAVKAINPEAILLLTANSKGVSLYTPLIHKVYDVPSISPISTIGAGDTFSAGIIYGLYKLGETIDSLPAIEVLQWDEIINYAILFATHVCLSYDNYLSYDFVKDFNESNI
jgi:fructokinase